MTTTEKGPFLSDVELTPPALSAELNISEKVASRLAFAMGDLHRALSSADCHDLRILAKTTLADVCRIHGRAVGLRREFNFFEDTNTLME